MDGQVQVGVFLGLVGKRGTIMHWWQDSVTMETQCVGQEKVEWRKRGGRKGGRKRGSKEAE